VALSFEVQRRGAGQVMLTLSGELDQDTASSFHQALATALTELPCDLLLDLSMVTAIGAGGIGMLLAVRRAADLLRCRVALHAASATVRRQMHARGLANDLTDLPQQQS
jgi:anti-anti-sigma factor